MVRAEAIITDGWGNFQLDELEARFATGGRGPGQIEASGVCHTDFDSMSWGQPCVMGHEGAGIVEACGPGVYGLRKGDRILLNWAMPCGSCFRERQEVGGGGW